MKLLLATRNQGKIIEFKKLLSDMLIEIIDPEDDVFDVEETGTTFEENARLKAKGFSERFGDIVTVADDSGLIVDALDGRPGVYSKRYGENDLHRMQKLLSELEEISEEKRTARFVSVISLYGPGYDELFEGTVKGQIGHEMRGDQGFGYDPIFIPEGNTKTFGELGLAHKNEMSHRARSLMKLKEFLKTDVKR